MPRRNLIASALSIIIRGDVSVPRCVIYYYYICPRVLSCPRSMVLVSTRRARPSACCDESMLASQK